MKNKKQKYIRESRLLFNQQPAQNADDNLTNSAENLKNNSSNKKEDLSSAEKEKIKTRYSSTELELASIDKLQEILLASDNKALEMIRLCLGSNVDSAESFIETNRPRLKDPSCLDKRQENIHLQLRNMAEEINRKDGKINDSNISKYFTELQKNTRMVGFDFLFQQGVENAEENFSKGDNIVEALINHDFSGMDNWEEKEKWVDEECDVARNFYSESYEYFNAAMRLVVKHYFDDESHDLVFQKLEEVKEKVKEVEQTRNVFLLTKMVDEFSDFVVFDPNNNLNLVFTDSFHELPDESQQEIIFALSEILNVDLVALNLDLEFSPDYEIPFHEGRAALMEGDFSKAKAFFLKYLKQYQDVSQYISEKQSGNIIIAKECLGGISLQELAVIEGQFARIEQTLQTDIIGDLEKYSSLGMIKSQADMYFKDLRSVFELYKRWFQDGTVLTLEEAEAKILSYGGSNHMKNGEEREWCSLSNSYERIKEIKGGYLDFVDTFNGLENRKIKINEAKKSGDAELLRSAEAEYKEYALQMARFYRENFPQMSVYFFDLYFNTEYDDLIKKQPELSREAVEKRYEKDPKFQRNLEKNTKEAVENIMNAYIEDAKEKWPKDSEEEFDENKAREKIEALFTEEEIESKKNELKQGMIDEKYEQQLKCALNEDMILHGRKGLNEWNEYNDIIEIDRSWYQFWRFTDEEWTTFKRTFVIDVALMMASFGVANVAQKAVGKKVFETMLRRELSKKMGKQAAQEMIEESLKQGGMQALKKLATAELGAGVSAAMSGTAFVPAFGVENLAFVTVHDSLNAVRTGKFHALSSGDEFVKAMGHSILTLGALKTTGAVYGNTLAKVGNQRLLRVQAAHMFGQNAASVVALTGTAYVGAKVIDNEELTEHQMANVIWHNIAVTAAFAGAHMGPGVRKSFSRKAADRWARDFKVEGKIEIRKDVNPEEIIEPIKKPDEVIGKIEKTDKLETPLSNEQKRELLQPELLAKLSTEEYIALWRRLNPYFLSHITRHGFRDHNEMVYHSAGMHKFHEGFTKILKQKLLRPATARRYNLLLRDEASVRKFLEDEVLNPKNEELISRNEMVIDKEKPATKEEAKILLNLILSSTLSYAPQYADITAVHFAAEMVSNRYYGAETGNEC